MELKLNSQNPEILLQLNSEFSYLLIQSVSVTSLKNIAMVRLTAELNYIEKGGFIGERKEYFPIHLLTVTRQVVPVFQLNKLIKNEIFTLGKFYNILKLKFSFVGNDDDKIEFKNIQMTIDTLSNKINRIEKKGNSLFFGKSPFFSL